jgi:hypothetical protein
MSKKNKITFEVVASNLGDFEDGTKVQLAVLKPTPAQKQEATRIYSVTWANGVRDKLLLRDSIGDYMKEQGIWGDEQEAKLQTLLQNISKSEKALSAGKIKKSEAKALALKLWDLRSEMRQLIAHKTMVENNSVESQAENARFNYLVSVCSVYNETGDRVFSSLEDYLDKDEEWSYECAAQMSNLLYELDPDFEKNLPENKFLKRFGYVNDDLALINESGKTISRDGKTIDSEGYYVDPETGERCDINGNPITQLKVEDAEFFD